MLTVTALLLCAAGRRARDPAEGQAGRQRSFRRPAGAEIMSADFLDDLPELDLPEPPRRPDRPDPDCVLWTRVGCPKCGSDNCPVTNSNHIPVRYHKCNNCGRTFKSIETNYRGDPAI